METYTFQTLDKTHTLTVKKEFLQKCPNPEDYSMLDLNSKFLLLIYLHNESGPAVIRHQDNFQEEWLNGYLKNPPTKGDNK